VQRVTLAAPGLPWPHYFVDLSGVGGSADPAGNLVIIAACRQLTPDPVTPATPAAPPSTSASPSGTAGGASSSPSARATAPASSAAGRGCLRPELVALNL